MGAAFDSICTSRAVHTGVRKKGGVHLGVCRFDARAGRPRSKQVRHGDEDAQRKGDGCKEAKDILQTIERVVHLAGVFAQRCARKGGELLYFESVTGTGKSRRGGTRW